MGYRLQDAVAMARHQLDGLLRDSGAHVVDRIDLGTWTVGAWYIHQWEFQDPKMEVPSGKLT